MATLTPERARSPAGSLSRLSAGPTYKSSSTAASLEVSQKYSERPTRQSYGSDYEVCIPQALRSGTNCSIMLAIRSIADT